MDMETVLIVIAIVVVGIYLLVLLRAMNIILSTPPPK